jgi:hypothetical protein
MDIDLIRARRALAKGQLFRVRDGQGRRVECLSGCLWVTQEADPRDVVLEPGDGFTIERGGDTWLSALADSSFVLFDAPVPAAPRAAGLQRPAGY